MITAPGHPSPMPTPGLDNTAFGQLGEQASALLRSAGSRRTQGLIAALLEASPGHLSAAELEQRIHAAGWRSDLSAIHRAMVSFIDLGLVHPLPAPGPVAYGPAHRAHHHAICTGCGAVTEVPLADLSTTAAAADIALQQVAFHLDPDGLALRGRCRRCGPARRAGGLKPGSDPARSPRVAG